MSDEIYCEDEGEWVSEYHCSKCEEFGCEHHPEKKKAERVVIDLTGSEALQELQTRLEQSFLPKDAIDSVMESLSDVLSHTVQNDFEKLIQSAAKLAVAKFWTNTMSAKADEQIKDALAKKVLLVDTKNNVTRESVQEVLCARITKYFSTDDSRGRKLVENTIKSAIEKKVDATVSEAFDESKKETTDKYNKEAMKRMMQAMAIGIKNDKRLLAMMTDSDQ